jgi:hypothetical protein
MQEMASQNSNNSHEYLSMTEFLANELFPMSEESAFNLAMENVVPDSFQNPEITNEFGHSAAVLGPFIDCTRVFLKLCILLWSLHGFFTQCQLRKTYPWPVLIEELSLKFQVALT